MLAVMVFVFPVKIDKKYRILMLLYINSTVKCLMAVMGNLGQITEYFYRNVQAFISIPSSVN